MDKTFVPTAELKHALALLCPYKDPVEDPDTLRGGAVATLMKALGLQTLVVDPFDGMIDEQRRIDDAEGFATALANAADTARDAITMIEAPWSKTPPGWPEVWEGKAFARVAWSGEDNASFLCISPNQSDTILGDVLEGLVRTP